MSVILAGQYNRKTALTWCHKNPQKNTLAHSMPLLGRVVHKGYRSRYLVAHNCTTSGFHAAFQFRWLLGSTMYCQSIVCACSVTCVTVTDCHCHSLSLWAEVPSSSDECASESDSNISYLMCWSVWFILVAMLLNALGPNLAHIKHNPFWLTVFKASAFPCLSYVVITLTWNGFKCWVEGTLKHEPTYQKSQEEIHAGEWRTFACGPILH